MAKQATLLKKQKLAETFMRQAILAAAKKALAANTYDRTSLDLIAQEAGISRGTIYLYFSGKEDLLGEVLKESLQRFIESGKAAAVGDQPPLDQLRAIVHAHLEMLAADVDMFKIALAEKTNLVLNPRGHQIQTLWHMYQDYAAWVGRLLKQAIGAKQIRPVPCRRTALLLLDMVLMVMYQRLAAPTDLSLTQEADALMDLFVSGLSGGTQGPVRKRMRANEQKKLARVPRGITP